jgi:hypothetical protein
MATLTDLVKFIVSFQTLLSLSSKLLYSDGLAKSAKLAKPTMKLSSIEITRHTTFTEIASYIIPGVDKSLAYLQVTTSTVEPSGKTSAVVEVINAVKDRNLKVLKGCRPTFVKDSFFERIKTNNPFWDCECHEMSDGEILEGNISEKNLIWFYSSGHIIFDSNAVPYTLPRGFDYIGSPFSNKHCNLPELLKYLKGHPWVLNKEDLEIEDIPYYNCEYDYDQCISRVIIRPDQETYAKIYELVKADKYFSSRISEHISSYLHVFYPETHNDWLGIAPFLENQSK